MKTQKIVLTTLPLEGEFVSWTTPKFFNPTNVNKYMPLGILSLASNISQKNEIVLLDPSSNGWTIEQTIEKIEQEKPDILGLSAVTRRVYAMNKILDKTSPPYKVVGGPHTTYYAKQILEKGADAVFIGGLADNEFREAIETKPKGIINCNTKINDIKFPKRELLNVNDYFPKEFILFKAQNRLPMFSSIGCPNKCYFCNVQGKRIQRKYPKIVMEEMQYLNQLGSGSIHVLDDNFNVSEKYLHKVLDEMDAVGWDIEWSGRGQARMSNNLTKRLSEHGFKRIHVGIEAFDDEILRFFNKAVREKDIYKFCETMNKNNIDILGYFIVGAPVETKQYRKELSQKIKENGIKLPYFNILFPEPDTPYYSDLLKKGIYKKDHWAEYMSNPTPYYEIPHPFGEIKKQEDIDYVNELIKEFKPKK